MLRNRLEEGATVSPLRSVLNSIFCTISWWEPIKRLSIMLIRNSSACYLRALRFWQFRWSEICHHLLLVLRRIGRLNICMPKIRLWRLEKLYSVSLCVFPSKFKLCCDIHFISAEGAWAQWTLNGMASVANIPSRHWAVCSRAVWVNDKKKRIRLEKGDI